MPGDGNGRPNLISGRMDSRNGPFRRGIFKAFLRNGPWFHRSINAGQPCPAACARRGRFSVRVSPDAQEILALYFQTASELYPKALLHFEDFGPSNARRILVDNA